METENNDSTTNVQVRNNIEKLSFSTLTRSVIKPGTLKEGDTMKTGMQAQKSSNTSKSLQMRTNTNMKYANYRTDNISQQPNKS